MGLTRRLRLSMNPVEGARPTDERRFLGLVLWLGISGA